MMSQASIVFSCGIGLPVTDFRAGSGIQRRGIKRSSSTAFQRYCCSRVFRTGFGYLHPLLPKRTLRRWASGSACTRRPSQIGRGQQGAWRRISLVTCLLVYGASVCPQSLNPKLRPSGALSDHWRFVRTCKYAAPDIIILSHTLVYHIILYYTIL